MEIDCCDSLLVEGHSLVRLVSKVQIKAIQLNKYIVTLELSPPTMIYGSEGWTDMVEYVLSPDDIFLVVIRSSRLKMATLVAVRIAICGFPG